MAWTVHEVTFAAVVDPEVIPDSEWKPQFYSMFMMMHSDLVSSRDRSRTQTYARTSTSAKTDRPRT
jgi:hypothetical protein